MWADIDMEDMWRLAARHISPDHEEDLVRALVQVEAQSWSRPESTRLSGLLAAASASVGVDVASAVLEEAAGHHLDSWTPHIRHHPASAQVLQALRAAGLRIGLLSNTHWPRGFHEHFLERDGLSDLIEARLYTSEMAFVKPHPSAFEAALAAVGVSEPGRAVFVGDRLYDDIWGAAQAGMHTVWIRNDSTPAYDAEPDVAIGTLADLPAAVSALTSRV